jgi:hypothetical protein
MPPAQPEHTRGLCEHAGLLGVCWVVKLRLNNEGPPLGWGSLMAALLIFSGVQMIGKSIRDWRRQACLRVRIISTQRQPFRWSFLENPCTMSKAQYSQSNRS